MKYIIFILIMLLGCKESSSIVVEPLPYIEMNTTTIELKEHKELCRISPASIVCTTPKSIGDIKPTKKYVLEVVKIMNLNFKYEIDNIWKYNSTIYEELIGDCEDISTTMAQHMINDGIDNRYLHLVYMKTSDTTSHMFLAVDTVDAGLLHIDYAYSGYPIEPKINFHMRLDDAGVDRWIKGNIN